jgi:hypothetical protein
LTSTSNFVGVIVGIKPNLKGGTNMPLADIFVKGLKPSEKPKKDKDGDGLYLYTTPSGLKHGGSMIGSTANSIHLLSELIL